MGSALVVSLLASPSLAQPVPNPGEDNAQMMHHDTMRHHEMSRHSRMDMRGRTSRDHMMRWCHSMSYRRMMRNPNCRAMMHLHHMGRLHQHWTIADLGGLHRWRARRADTSWASGQSATDITRVPEASGITHPAPSDRHTMTDDPPVPWRAPDHLVRERLGN